MATNRNTLTVAQPTAISTEWNQEQIDIIKQQIAVGCSDGELALFGQVCQRTGLDPFSRQIYAISRNAYNPETKQKEPKMTIQVSIDGFRTIAARSGLYGGSKSYWCGEDGRWVDVWLSSKPPAAAKTEVWRVGSPEPFTAVAKFGSYAQSFNGKLSGLWEKMPEVLIAKCSESLALRKAFPAELSGLYTSEEMTQADATAPAQIPQYSPEIQKQRQGLIDCMEILGWDLQQQKTWAQSIHNKPSSQWSLDEWKAVVTKAHVEIDALNSKELAVDVEVA
jgi:phage recombination protein Bet